MTSQKEKDTVIQVLTKWFSSSNKSPSAMMGVPLELLQIHSLKTDGYWWASLRDKDASSSRIGGTVFLVDINLGKVTEAPAAFGVQKSIQDYEKSLGVLRRGGRKLIRLLGIQRRQSESFDVPFDEINTAANN